MIVVEVILVLVKTLINVAELLLERLELRWLKIDEHISQAQLDVIVVVELNFKSILIYALLDLLVNFGYPLLLYLS